MSHATHIAMEESPPKLTHADLHQFTGDLQRYQHPLHPKVIYTPGVQFLAERGQAYWLIDAIASYFGSPQMEGAMAKDPRLASLQFWRLTVTDGSALLIAEADAGEEPFIRQEIAFTDFPLDIVEIWAGYDGSRWTLYLPSEH
jgi:hypothetical protein